MNTLTLTCPDDWHLHLRDRAALRDTVAMTARCFARAVVMPNLNPPVITTSQALAYRDRILEAVPPGARFEPLMTLFLTEDTPPVEVERAKASGRVHAVKLYPAGATTNADAGVRELAKTYSTLAALERHGMPLLVHGEVTAEDVDVFDRERVFIDRCLAPLVARFPGLRIVFEHITTAEAVEYVRSGPSTLAATVTAHHLALNRNAMFCGGLRPHHFCLPVLKRERDRRALLQAVASGSPKFFLGTDSAPHAKGAKEAARGCAGMYTAHAALELYAELFESVGASARLEGFASHYGADFYRLARNKGTLTLAKRPRRIPAELPLGDETVVPFRAGETVSWSLQE
jgi:dihydroorotase